MRLQVTKNGNPVKRLHNRGLDKNADYDKVLADCRKRLPDTDFDAWSFVDEAAESAKAKSELLLTKVANAAYLATPEGQAESLYYAENRSKEAEKKASFIKKQLAK